MFKVLSVVSAFAVLWIRVFSDECLYQSQVWGGVDPNIFYYCNTVTNQSGIANCGQGTGFVSNASATGCIPWTDWSDDCINKTDPATINCEGDTLVSPNAAGDPAFFYLCPAQNATPVQLACPNGTAFYNGNYYIGCFPFEMWRNITGCVNL